MDHYALTPLSGGYSGETFLAQAAGERTVVRIYARRSTHREPHAPEVDAAVLRLVRGLIPVPEVLEVRRRHPLNATPGLLVTSFLPGERLDLLLPRLDERALDTVGRNFGEVLARLAGMPMLRTGAFLDPELRIGPFPPGADDLVEWVERHRSGTALARWPARRYERLLEVSRHAQDLLDGLDRACLVHGDFNAKNLLVHPETLAVSGVLDWEFAHAGSPVADLGNLLRFERATRFVAAVLDGYRSGLPDVSPDVLDQARAADLFALVELAGRRGENAVTEEADRLLAAVADGRDLHAVP